MSAEEVDAREELYEIAELLGEAVAEEKEAKARKEKLRSPFFDLISEIVRDEIPLAREVVEVPNAGEFDSRAWRARNYPEYRIIAIDVKDAATLSITLEENEAFKKFEFTFGGKKYGRTIRMKGAGFDAEGFFGKVSEGQAMLEWNGEKSDPILEELLSCVEKEVVTHYSLDEAKAMKVMADHPETVALFQEFQIPGTPEPALMPIRAAKEEDE